MLFQLWGDNMESEYDGGTVMKECPDCGQYCKIPDHYHAEFERFNFTGCYADSYCKRCKKSVKLEVIFI